MEGEGGCLDLADVEVGGVLAADVDAVVVVVVDDDEDEGKEEMVVEGDKEEGESI